MSTGPTPPIGGTPIVTPQTVINFLRSLQDAVNEAINKIVDEVQKLIPSNRPEPSPQQPPPPPDDKTQPSVGGSVPASAHTIDPGAP